MKRLVLILLAFIPLFSFAQDIEGNKLRIYENASIGEDGGTLDMNNNKVVNVADPVDNQDAVNKQWFMANAFSPGQKIDSIMWTTNLSNLVVEKGKLYLDSIFQALRYSPDGINSIFLGRMLLNPLVINNTGSQIDNLTVVYVDGAFSDRLSIQVADKSTFDASRVVGVTTEDIANGATGNVTRFGLIQGNTSGLYVGVAVGDLVYLDNNGGITDQPATNGDFNVFIGVIKKLGITDGELYVNPNIEDYTAETLSPRGWSDNVVASTTLAPVSGTRTFSLVGTGYTYENGVKYEFDNPSAIWNDVEGNILVYLDKNVVTFAYNQTDAVKRDILKTKAGLSDMYWDATNDTTIFANDLRHNFKMSDETWAFTYDVHRCIIPPDGGLALTDIIADASGDLNAHAQFGNESGEIRNQDIITPIPAQSSTTGYTVFYRDGVNNWRSVDGAPFPVISTGTGRLAWNEDVGGSWQLTEVANNDYVLYHLFVSNTLGDKLGTVIGQNEYALLADAQEGALKEINSLLFGQFPIKELAPVATIIYQTSNAYANAVQGRIVSAEDVFGNPVDYIDWRKGVSGAGGTGGASSSFDGLTDTPNSKAGQAGKAVVVDPGETTLIYEEVAKTINGISPIAGNHNITMTHNKVGEDVEINTTGTGVSTTFSVADNDSDPDNENQDLGNSKLNNDVTVTISNGTNTTITNIARTDFANTFTQNQTISRGTGNAQLDLSPAGAAQDWRLISRTDDIFTIQGATSGNVFDVKDGGINSSGYLQIGGITTIDASRNFDGGSGTFSGKIETSDQINLDNPSSSRFIIGKTNGTPKWYLGSGTSFGGESDDDVSLYSYSGAVNLYYSGLKKFETTSVGAKTTGDHEVSGTVTATNVFKKATQTLSGTTPTYNTSTSVNAKITLTGNTTATLTNLIDGMSGNFYVTQDGTGGHTLTLSPTPKVINGGAGSITLTGTPGSTDIISWAYDGTNLYVTYGLNYN